ncbi:hypothetical protein [Mycobacteroides chelonae]|uniref:hypothetical protein n=1 Tax=Mycobacteroides chelonae TaxID=1774 RepID=UPI000993898A|nr:hypothetical protein [Mycobacteroides chelonae]
MKKNMVAASAALALTVGLSACGSHTSAPEAQGPLPDVFPVEQGCTDIPKPSDPHGLIGNNWLSDNACAIFNLNHPGEGVDAEQAARIVYDARMKALAGKRDISLLARQGSAQISTPSGVETDFKSAISERRAALKAELTDSGLALQGQAPQGFRIEYLKNSDGPHSASPGLSPGK